MSTYTIMMTGTTTMNMLMAFRYRFGTHISIPMQK